MKHLLFSITLFSSLFMFSQSNCVHIDLLELMNKKYEVINSKLNSENWANHHYEISNFKRNIGTNIELEYVSYIKDRHLILNFKCENNSSIILVKTEKRCFDRIKDDLKFNYSVSKVQNKSNSNFFEEHYKLVLNNKDFKMVLRSNNTEFEILCYDDKIMGKLKKQDLENENLFNTELLEGDEFERKRSAYDISTNPYYESLLEKFPKKAYIIEDKIDAFIEGKINKLTQITMQYEIEKDLLNAKKTLEVLLQFIKINNNDDSYSTEINDNLIWLNEIETKISSDKKLDLERRIGKEMENKNYDKAKYYAEQLKVIDPDNLKNKAILNEISRIRTFLAERVKKTYDYFETENPTSLETIKRKLLTPTLFLLDNKSKVGFLKLNINILFSKEGQNLSSMECISANKEICSEISRDLNFMETAMINDFTVSADAKVNLDISWSNSKLIAEKTVSSSGINSINYSSSIGNANKNKVEGFIDNQHNNFGSYQFNLKKINVNNEVTYQLSPTKFKCKTGPSNAVFSLIYPGLGQYKVTNKQLGKDKMKLFGVIAGTSLISKLYSNFKYNKYLSSTNQTDIDRHYESANNANKVFFSTFLLSTCFYIEDFIYTIKKGNKNKQNELLINKKMQQYQF